MKKKFHHFSSLIFTQDINDGLNKLINSLKDVLPISQKVKKGKGLIFNVGSLRKSPPADLFTLKVGYM